MKKNGFPILFLLLFLFCPKGFSQYNNPPIHTTVKGNKPTSQATAFDMGKLTFGGGIGLQFGDYTLLNFAPQIGYSVTERLNTGLGFSYTYFRDSYNINGVRWKETRSYLGFNLYARYYPIENLVLLAQPDINRMWQSFDKNVGAQQSSKSKFVPALLLGAGLRYGHVEALLQYDVVQDDYSPYGKNIFYSVGYIWNF